MTLDRHGIPHPVKTGCELHRRSRTEHVHCDSGQEGEIAARPDDRSASQLLSVQRPGSAWAFSDHR